MRHWLVAGLLIAAACLSEGCAGLNFNLQGQNWGGIAKPEPPRISVAGTRLTRQPTNRQLAGWLCTQVTNPLICHIFGVVPPKSSLLFAFDIDLDADNPNSFPLPMVEVLTVFTAFPAVQGQKNLGAVCLSLCEDPNGCAQQPNACQSTEPEIRSLGDFAHAAVGFLTRLAAGQEAIENLRVRLIPAGGKARVVIRLELGVDAVVGLIRQVAQDAMRDLQRGVEPRFSIPYRVEGSVWLRVEHFGRLGAGYGPYHGTWNLQ
jgi:hypothetical protein